MRKRAQLLSAAESRLPWSVCAAVVLLLAWSAVPKVDPAPYRIDDFARLPALSGGRLKPLDTIARTSLLLLSGKQTFKRGERRDKAVSWLLDVLFKPAANELQVFQIDNPDVLGTLGIRQEPGRRLYSFAELQATFPELEKQVASAQKLKPETRSRYQTAIVNLRNKVEVYQKLQNTLQLAGATDSFARLRYFEEELLPAAVAHMKSGKSKKGGALEELKRFFDQYRFLAKTAEFYPLPAIDNAQRMKWLSAGEAFVARLNSDEMHPGLISYARMGDAYRAGDAKSFNDALREYEDWLSVYAPDARGWAAREWAFNTFAPFHKGVWIYVAAFLLMLLSWMVWPGVLRKTAFGLLLIGFVIHTGGLVARMLIQGRPPVTNLYSSAIFVGWMAALLGIALEARFKQRIGALMASAIGALTLIIALHLDAQGDTLEMMRAVLDSNFWLATHVTCITIGYSSTFLSGALGCFYIFQRWLAPAQARENEETLAKMVYGVVCFSTFFSFLGTILGGIWADQSWGRFWGWDPKENGALMIVLWNVAILHARWGRVVGTRGVMVMAVFGNIVTSLSWFGVNMLGIGLHSYGFMDKAFYWLLAFVATQLAIMGAGFAAPAARGEK